ncbi:MAG: DUF167 domain-containing protein [Patescibacteria group bacterium]
MKLTIHLTPNAKKSEIAGTQTDLFGNEVLKIKVAAPPVEGKANEALIAFLADHFKVGKGRITILKGHTARTKVVEIEK